MKFKFFAITTLLLWGTLVYAQDANPPKDWFLLSPSSGYPGISADMLYKRLPSGQTPDTVIVAVIDSGVDYMHEDLKDVMWVNKGEIPGNGKDDDNNGYIDDIHGWNFIGNAKGENVAQDNLEVTRLYAKYRDKYQGKNPESLSKKEKEEYELYKETKEVVENNRASVEQQAQTYTMIYKGVEAIKEKIGKEPITAEDLDAFETSDPLQGRIKQIAMAQMQAGMTFEIFAEQVKEGYDHFNSQYNYHYNPDFDSRKLVGDNYADKMESNYGNADVKGPDSFHGTHVAGIIAAKRGNDIGIDGVASHVKIMAIRVVPDGDERDKDVANGIRYAVDNGASVINMSFGKGYSPYKEVVDAAVKYAAKNDVLLVHAAGNDGKMNTTANNYPNDTYMKKGLFGPKNAKNWVEVGALNWEGGEHLAADFSNYSKDYVDLFAPGTAIYSTVPGSEYRNAQGTSMASPVVAGVAAVIRSYFPDLTAEQVKDIMMESTVKSNEKVIIPGDTEKVPFSELSVSGGMVDVEAAVERAIKTQGKKKGKSAKKRLTKLEPKPKA